MHKKELVEKIASKTDLDKQSATKVLNLVLSEIAGALKKGSKVTLTSFGTFSVKKKKKRTMRNIQTGAPVEVPAHKAVAFKVGSPLKKAVWK